MLFRQDQNVREEKELGNRLEPQQRLSWERGIMKNEIIENNCVNTRALR